MPMRNVRLAMLGGVAMVLFSAGTLFYGLAEFVKAFGPILPPTIAGATPGEQGSEVVLRGFALGRTYRATLATAHGDSWLVAARLFESGQPWGVVKARWANQDRIWRDEPFERIIQPEIDRLLGPDAPDSPERRRAATLFLRAFAAGLKDRR